jgi:hypothetical protein
MHPGGILEVMEGCPHIAIGGEARSSAVTGNGLVDVSHALQLRLLTLSRFLLLLRLLPGCAQ